MLCRWAPGLLLTAVEAARLGNDLWLRPKAAVEKFLAGPQANACDLPVIDVSGMTWDDFTAQGHQTEPALLKGLLHADWIQPEDYGRDVLMDQFGEENVWIIDGRHDHTFTTSSNSASVTSLRNFTEQIAPGALSRVATGYDLALEQKIFRALWNADLNKVPEMLRNFDQKPIVSIAMSKGTGVQLHNHSNTWLALLHGAKAWWIASSPETPEVAAEAAVHTAHPCTWLGGGAPKGMSFCVQHAGDVVYFPETKHATCNLHDYVFGIGSQGRLPLEWSELDRALHRGDVAAVKEGLQEDPEVDITSLRTPEASYAGGTSPLHLAARRGARDLMDYLLELRADPTLTTNNGIEPLHQAAFNSHLPEVELLIQLQGDVNAVANDGARPLHLAARPGHPGVFDTLLQAQADVHASDHSGDQALHIASSQGHLHLTEVLLSRRANVEKAGQEGMRPVHAASSGGHVEVLQLLLKAKADFTPIDARGIRPLGYAAAAGHLPTADFMLKRADVNVNTPAKDGLRPIHGAAHGGHQRVLEALLRHGADANAHYGRGASAMHLAAHRGHLEACKLLIKHGADAEAADEANVQPLHWAAAGGHLELVKLFVKQGAEVRAPDATGNQPLHYASGGGHEAVIQYLLSKKARVDIRNNEQQRPLDMAIAGGKLLGLQLPGGHPKAVEMLLSKGARVLPDDRWMAEDAGHLEIADILLEALEKQQPSSKKKAEL